MNENNEETETPWSKLSRSWGHPWHSMCSYLGSYPAPLARSLICMLSDPEDFVHDPFSGRGTTLLEARLLGRRAVASDLNPIAVALTRAKNTSITAEEVRERLGRLRDSFDSVMYIAEASVQPDNIQLIFDTFTLAQLCYLRRQLLNSNNPVDQFLIGVILGIMHGSVRQDGSSAYLSISMPNTFSMSPGYVQRFVEKKQLQRIPRNAFDIAASKVERLFQEPQLNPANPGVVATANVRHLTSSEALKPFQGKVDLIVTSPPYLNIINYGKQNWIRNWFFDNHEEYGSIDDLDDELSLRDWISFTEASVGQMKEMLCPGGVVAMVIGDVVRAGSAISLARELIQHLTHKKAFNYIGCLNDRIQNGVKTTRIWKETKGKATNIDRIVVLSDETPNLRYQRLAKDLFGDSSVKIEPITADQLRKEAKQFAY